MPCEVLGCSADGHVTLEHLQADVRPFADGLQVDAAVDEGLSKVSSASAESIGANGDRTRNLVRFEEFDSLTKHISDFFIQ